MQKQRHPNRQPIDFAQASDEIRTKKAHKYKSRKVTIDGIDFPSRTEGRRYLQLKGLEQDGKIRDLLVASKYNGPGSKKKRIALGLQFPFHINDKEIASYVCDFRYKTPNGCVIIEDVKGMRTPIFLMKKRMMKAAYDIDVLEVTYAQIPRYNLD